MWKSIHATTDQRKSTSCRPNSAKAHRLFDWSPRVTFRELVRIMVDADMEAVEVKPRGEGLQILKGKFGDWHRWETGVTAVLKGSGAGVD